MKFKYIKPIQHCSANKLDGKQYHQAPKSNKNHSSINFNADFEHAIENLVRTKTTPINDKIQEEQNKGIFGKMFDLTGVIQKFGNLFKEKEPQLIEDNIPIQLGLKTQRQ